MASEMIRRTSVEKAIKATESVGRGMELAGNNPEMLAGFKAAIDMIKEELRIVNNKG